LLHTLNWALTMTVMFGILIFVHELGHFLAAKLFKFKVYEFAFGLPFGKKWRYWHDGETEYTVRAVLLGGFVGFAEADADDETREAQMAFFNAKPIWQRFIVILAGPIASFLLGWLAFVVLVASSGVETSPRIKVEPETPAFSAGLRSGDVVTKINAVPINTIAVFKETVSVSEGKPIQVTYAREGATQTLEVIPKATEEKGAKIYRIGVGLETRTRPAKASEILTEANRQTSEFFKGLRSIFSSGKKLKENVGGPIAIAGTVSEVVKLDWPDRIVMLLMMAGQLSLSLYAANLFVPIPVFDGGQIVLLLIEAIRRRQLTKEQQMGVAMVGWALVLVLFISIGLNDILRLLGRG
jgi:regulator of sigma E protease